MEIIIGLVVVAGALYFIFRKKEETAAFAETPKAPYKVEAPAAAPSVAEQATQAVVESIAPAKEKPAKKAKAPAAKTPKAPRKPRAPKA